jgi:hypothetical protein
MITALLIVVFLLLLIPIGYSAIKNGFLPNAAKKNAWSLSSDYSNSILSPIIQILNLILFVYISYQLHGLSQKNEEENLKIQKEGLELNRQIALLQIRNDSYIFIRNDLDPLIKQTQVLPLNQDERMEVLMGINRKIDDTILRYSNYFNDLYSSIELHDLQMTIEQLQFTPSTGLQRDILIRYDALLKKISSMVLDTASDQSYKDHVIQEYFNQQDSDTFLSE